MRNRWVFAFLSVLLGCSEIEPGSCYPNPTGGAGGAGSMPIGAGVGVSSTTGTYGADPPKQPQDATDPPVGCIQPQGPCEEKCLADYEAAAAACGKIDNQAQRMTCQDAAYAKYKNCRGNCKTASKSCTDMYDACMDKGYPCTRQIRWGKTLCAYCRADCQADRPYKYSECYKCGFE